MSEQIPLLDSLALFEGNELALYQIAKQFGDIDHAPLSELREATISFLEPLVERGFIEGGRVFVPIKEDSRDWVPFEGTSAEVLDRARRIWDVEGRHPELLDDIWFMLTWAGELALIRERASGRPSVVWPRWRREYHRKDL